MLQHAIVIPQFFYPYFCENINSMAYKAVIAGASGLVGSHLLTALLQAPEYTAVSILVRNTIRVAHPKLKQIVVDFSHLADHGAEIEGNAVFCCLGSTLKKTPDLKDYREIDHDYPLQLGHLALQNGVRQYHFVSALGANASKSNFYLKTKGETEDELKKLALESLHIYRPGLLTGHRTNFRPLESIAGAVMKAVAPLLVGPLKKFRSISARSVAIAMYKKSLTQTEGTFIYSSEQI